MTGSFSINPRGYLRIARGPRAFVIAPPPANEPPPEVSPGGRPSATSLCCACCLVIDAIACCLVVAAVETATATRGGRGLLLLGDLRDQRLGREQQARHRRRVLDRKS